MRINFTLSKSSARLAALALLAVCLSQPPVRAQETTERVLMSAPFGVARDQSVRLTLFVPNGAPASGHVKLFDGRGSPVAESAEVRISGGSFHSFHFEPNDIDLAGEEGTGRRELRASCWVRVDGPWARMDDPVAALEIIEASTGITDGLSNTVMLGERSSSRGGGSENDFLKSGANDFIMGIVPDQTLRVSVLNPHAPAAPGEDGRKFKMLFAVTILDADGHVIASSDEITLDPGEFHSFDLTPAPPPRGGGVQVRSHIRARFFSVVDRTQFALGSLEVINGTGKTTVSFPGRINVASGDIN